MCTAYCVAYLVSHLLSVSPSLSLSMPAHMKFELDLFWLSQSLLSNGSSGNSEIFKKNWKNLAAVWWGETTKNVMTFHQSIWCSWHLFDFVRSFLFFVVYFEVGIGTHQINFNCFAEIIFSWVLVMLLYLSKQYVRKVLKKAIFVVYDTQSFKVE